MLCPYIINKNEQGNDTCNQLDASQNHSGERKKPNTEAYMHMIQCIKNSRNYKPLYLDKKTDHSCLETGAEEGWTGKWHEKLLGVMEMFCILMVVEI